MNATLSTGRAAQAAAKASFYSGKTLERVEWWLSWGTKVDTLHWARLRLYSDGTADACFAEGSRLFGFTTAEDARYFLEDDEYLPVVDPSEPSTEAAVMEATGLNPPGWVDGPRQRFRLVAGY